jgi:hypothetical protein
VQQNWCRFGSVETTLESGDFDYDVACDAKALRGERRLETATGNEVGVGKECLVNGRSQVRAVTCHLNDDAEKRQAGEQWKRINRV